MRVKIVKTLTIILIFFRHSDTIHFLINEYPLLLSIFNTNSIASPNDVNLLPLFIYFFQFYFFCSFSLWDLSFNLILFIQLFTKKIVSVVLERLIDHLTTLNKRRVRSSSAPGLELFPPGKFNLSSYVHVCRILIQY
jgi:hypothetical protein